MMKKNNQTAIKNEESYRERLSLHDQVLKTIATVKRIKAEKEEKNKKKVNKQNAKQEQK